MGDDKSVSHILRSLLNSLGLDEEHRQKRMTYQKLLQLLFDHLGKGGYSEHLSLLLSGSSFETTTISGLSSDLDIMFVDSEFRVIDDIKDWRDDKQPTLLMDSTGCYRAFVKLYYLSPDYPGPFYTDMVSQDSVQIPFTDVNKDGQILLSNRVAPILGSVDEGDVHGPAFTLPATTKQCETDRVICFRCNSFPREAAWWKQRQTYLTRTRIDPKIIDGINHCYLVAIGNKISPTEHLEWRLSFSHIENRLIHAWNNVQYQCYILMKFINKDLIKPFVPEALCSYHFKTLIMWMNEEYQQEFFISSHLEQCVLMCIKLLLDAVRKLSLPHYFVQGCNLFYPKLTNNNGMVKIVAAVIENILASWPRCLFNISRCRLGEMFQNCLERPASLSLITTGVHERRRQEGHWYEVIQEQHVVCEEYIAMRDSFTCESAQSTGLSILSRLRSRANETYYNAEIRRFTDFAIKDILCNIGLERINCANSTAVGKLAPCILTIKRYSNSCSIDTGLKIAAHFFISGDYRESLALIDRFEEQGKRYAYYRCGHARVCLNYFPFSHVRHAYDNEQSITELCKHHHQTAVIYKQQHMKRIPKGLVYEMFRSTAVSPVADPMNYPWHTDLVIHCPMYLYYLRFLNHRAQGHNAHQQVALDNMEWSAKELCERPRTHEETNYNIVGHCFRSIGDTRRAYKTYRKSFEMKRHHNAVLWHIAMLLRSEIRGER